MCVRKHHDLRHRGQSLRGVVFCCAETAVSLQICAAASAAQDILVYMQAADLQMINARRRFNTHGRYCEDPSDESSSDSDGDDDSDSGLVVPSHLRHLQVNAAPPRDTRVQVAPAVFLERCVPAANLSMLGGICTEWTADVQMKVG